MKLTRINDPYHNPFHNRFHVPVHSRPDEMQAYTHMVWLNEPVALDHATEKKQHSRHLGRSLAGALGLVLFVVLSAAFLLN
jgi:hypothetical protein